MPSRNNALWSLRYCKVWKTVSCA